MYIEPKKHYIVGVDLDTTLLIGDLIQEVSNDMGYNYTSKDVTDWQLNCFPEKFRKEIFKRFSSKKYMCDERYKKPVKDAKKKLYEWRDAGHKLILITARVREIRLETKKLINKYFPKFDKTIFVNMGKPKKHIFKREGLTHWIDDNGEDCRSAVDMGIKTYLISNENTKYNWNMRKYKNINVVDSIIKIKLEG